MKLFKWIDSKVKTLNWYDISQIKTASFLFALMLVVAWNDFKTFILQFEWYWYLLSVIIFSIMPVSKIFK